MDILSAVLLGVIQGITEFLPISSSGHLIVANYLLGLEKNNDILFEVIVHLGTLFAIIYYYKNDIKDLSYNTLLFKPDAIKYLCLIIIATIPAIFAGLLFNEHIKNLYHISSVPFFFIITGIVIFLSNFSKEKSREMSIIYALIIGIMQAFAILPGISRSGVTISMALLLGINRKDASKFVFFMAIPIITGAVLLEILNVHHLAQVNYISLFIGFITSAIIGYFSISWLIDIINKLHFWKFSFYCWLIGIILLLVV